MDHVEEMDLDLEELMLSSSDEQQPRIIVVQDSKEETEAVTPSFRRSQVNIPISTIRHGEVDTNNRESRENHTLSPCLVCSFKEKFTLYYPFRKKFF